MSCENTTPTHKIQPAAKQVLTHSRMSCFRDCPRKHNLRYEMGLRADRDSVPIRVGSVYHEMMDLAASGMDPMPALVNMEDLYERELVSAMFLMHQQHYARERLESVASELEFDLPLVNPETGRPSTIWRFRGKIDDIVMLDDGRLALLEYKSTTRDFSPGAEYWQRLHMDPQLSLYVIAARELGYEIETVLYDVTRRPMLKPLKATPEDKRKYKKDKSLYANLRDRDETPQEYSIRVIRSIADRPEHHFARIEIARLDQDLEDCELEMWQQQLAIREAQRSGHWYRNPNSCYGFFTCDYLPICLNRDLDTNTPTGFIRNENIHPELENATSGG